MNTERWRVLSEWHNTWLAAPTEQRAGLRASFATEHPDLLQVADELASSSGAVDGFLETPALVLAARDLAQDEPPLPDGTLVGPYRIVTLLARGGMGDVYRATDPRLDRDVALKTLTSAERGDGRAVERFLQEARITASLDHPNIVKVFDVGMSNGRPYLVSELLDGETLRAPIGRGPLAPPDARRIASALTSGLVAAHARGLVHRDLKPENVFLTRSGTAKILDFGIAKLAQDPALPRGLATLTGVVLGTAGYLAPEQVKGDPVDARTDLFALGSILFELMTGQRAFVREHTIDTLHAIVHDDPPDLLPAGTPLTAIVKRLLAKAPDARFQSAADLLWTLEQIDSTEVRAASPPVTPAFALRASTFALRATADETAGKPGRRFFKVRRGWAIAGAAGLAMVLMALLSGRFGERALGPSRRVQPDAVHVVASSGHRARLRTGRLTDRTAFRVHRRQRRRAATPVRAVARLARCHRHRRDRRSEEPVLVARRHVDRVFCPRQTDESGGRGRRPGRDLQCAGREGRGVESHGDDRVQPEHHFRGTLPGVGGRRPGATRDAGRLRPR